MGRGCRPVAHDDPGSTDKQPALKGNLDRTLNDLAPVKEARTDATQVMDPVSAPEPIEAPTDSTPVAATTTGLPPVPPTSTDLPWVSTSTDLPPVAGTETSLPDVPPAQSTVASLPPVPSSDALPPATEVTAPRLARAPAAKSEPAPRFEVTPGRVALAGLGVSVLGLLLWLIWPLLTRPAKPQPIEWIDAAPAPVAVAAPKPAPPPVAPPVAPPKPAADELRLDAKVHVIDPRALHAPDVSLEPTHKYRLTLKTDEPKAGIVLARLEEAEGWGVLHAMATHHALQFGGARTLRLHCEPGSLVKADTTMTLELEDLARKKQRQTLGISPATQCYDFEVGRRLEVDPGASKRVQLRSEQKAVLGEQVPLRVAYRIPVPGDPQAWRFGVLEPGDDVLVEGPGARFAILDPWLGDNEGEVVLQVLPGDTDSRGLVRPDGADTKFVPSRP